MKKTRKSLSVMMIAIFTTVVLLSGIPTSAAPKKNLKGTVSWAIYNWDKDMAQNLVKEFNKVYPDVKVNLVPFDGNLNGSLTNWAAAKKLPDVVYGWENLNYPISQGWVAPLDQYLKKDAEATYINSLVKSSYVFNKKTYAVPTGIQFNGILINLDMLDQLNIKKPSYNWTINEFKAIAKKATTKETSGINHVWNFDNVITGLMSRSLGEASYNQKKGVYDFTSGVWAKAVGLQKELQAVPGLVSDNLKNNALRDAGKLDDYQKKFGKDADAVREGKVLFIYSGTWDYGWEKTLPFKWDLYPLPSDASVGYRQPIHADHAFMMKTAKYPEAAFELLKWISYGTQGNLFRLNYKKNYKDADGKPQPDYSVPATTDSKVMSAFNALPFVQSGVKYMYSYMQKSVNKANLYRGDSYKFIPDFDKVEYDIIIPLGDKVREGKADAASVAVELDNKANAAIKLARDKFNELLKAVQAKEDK